MSTNELQKTRKPVIDGIRSKKKGEEQEVPKLLWRKSLQKKKRVVSIINCIQNFVKAELSPFKKNYFYLLH